MQTKTNIYAVLGLFIACFLCSSNLGVSTASATSVAITTNDNISLNASTANDGVTIDEESINITTTCNKGYDLTIATSTSTNLYLDGDSTKTATYTAVDGTSALNSSNNINKWGYTTTSDATSSTVFSPLSTTASSLRTISETTDITSETIPIYYGIKTDSTVNPGTYTMGDNGTITYYLTMNPQCSITNITYDGNNADEGTMAAIHENVKDGDVVNLVANNFSRQGYGFAGWSTDPDAGAKLLDNDNTNNPIVYGPQETVTLPEGFTDKDTDHDGIVKLYAVWLQSQGNLQDWVGCDNLDTATYDSTTGALDITKNSVTALTDQRDNDTYAVARLADGQCWMIENLRLDNDAAHNSDGSLAQGYGTSATYGNFAGLASPESTGFTDSYSPNNLYSNNGSNNTINIGASDFPEYRMPRFNDINTSTRASNPTSNNDTMYIYGNYYTWPAAVADVAYYSTNNESTTSTSLCPAGWHLPKGGGKAIVEGSHDNDFWNLGVDVLNGGINPTNYSSTDYPYYDGATEANPLINKLRAYPNNILYSGYFDTSSATNLGVYGCYWSATIADNNRSYSLTLEDNSYVYPGTRNNGKAYGRSVRCVTSTPQIYTIVYDANTTDTVTGTMEDQRIAIDETVALRTNAFQRSDYRFVKWNTKPDGTGTDYADSVSVTSLASVGETITLYAQWLSVYTVQYDGNGSDNDSTGMGSTDASTGIKTVAHTNVAEGDTFDLFASNFKKAGYGFVGWSTDANAWSKLTDNDATNDAKIWGPNEIFTAPAPNGTPITTLYAVWVPAETSGGNPVYLQNWTGCSAMTATTYNSTSGKLAVTKNSIAALTDQRDGNVYAIAKLADENCWMIENLRLDDSSELSTANTNIDSTNSTLPITNVYNVNSSLATKSNYLSATSDNWCIDENAACYNQSLLNTTNITANITPSLIQTITYVNAHLSFDDTIYSYGNYYNWYSATAGYGTYSSPNSEPTAGDLCPTGWKLPYGNTGTSGTNIGGTKGGFSYLDKQMGGTGESQSTGAASNRWRMFPNNFIYSGAWKEDTAVGRGLLGEYWSASAYSQGAFGLFIYHSFAQTGNTHSKRYQGFTIRCISNS